MRLFIAIRLTDEIRDMLNQVQHDFRRRGVRGNYTMIENLHLTLAFVGEYDDPDYVVEALSAVPFSPFALSLSGLGHFGNLWWIGIKENEALTSCVSRVRLELSEAGIPFDRKKFSPHITLIRKASGRIPEVQIADAEMQIDHISLMRSERGPNGMIYTELWRN